MSELGDAIPHTMPRDGQVTTEEEIAFDEDERNPEETPFILPGRKLSITAIEKVLRDMETKAVPPILPEGRAMAEQLAYQYFSIVMQNQEQAQHALQQAQDEDVFLRSLKAVTKDLGELSDVEKRILASNFVALYGLVVHGELETLYEKMSEKLALKGENLPATDEEKLTARVQLAQQFLKQINEKNKEADLAYGEKSPITVGIEVEYVDPIHKTIGRMVRSVSNNQVDAAYLHAWPDEEEEGMTVEEASFKHTPVTSILEHAGGFVLNEEDGNWHELSILPSASPRLALREVLTMWRAGALRSPWGIHETLGGVVLTPEHTEVMDISAIAMGAGYFPKKQSLGKEKSTLKEKYAKLSSLGENYYYFPFHKSRSSDEVLAYPKQKDSAVERRSLAFFRPREFKTFVEEVTFSYFAAWGVRAIQKPQEQRDSQDTVLAQAWNEVLDKWETLLGQEGIQNPPNEGRYLTTDAVGYLPGHLRGTTDYEKFLAKIRATSHNKPEFIEATQEIIRDYSKKARTVIGY